MQAHHSFDPYDLPAFKTSPYSPGRDDTLLKALAYCASPLTGKEIRPLILSAPKLCFHISVQYWCTENQDFGIHYSDTSVYSPVVIQRVYKSPSIISVSWPAMFPFLERCKGQRRECPVMSHPCHPPHAFQSSKSTKWRFFSFSEESLGFLQVSWMPLEIHLGSGHSLLAYFRADLDSKDWNRGVLHNFQFKKIMHSWSLQWFAIIIRSVSVSGEQLSGGEYC